MNRKITKHLVLVGFLGVVLGLHWSGGEVQQFKHSVQKILQAEEIPRGIVETRNSSPAATRLHKISEIYYVRMHEMFMLT